ncbi:MAG: hypothetical protein KGQ67_16830 [Betaproteobacteria bacterium]|nr:hypothetical protein [Betaproteobacteria bacterium]
MTADRHPDPAAPPVGPREAWEREEDARVHARVLQLAAGFCLSLLALAFGCYAAGIAPGLVPANELPAHWQQSSAHWRALMVQAAAAGAGDANARFAPGSGDLLCLMAMLGLCLASLPALGVLLVRLLRRRDWPLAAFAALNIVVLEVALVAALV